MLQKRLAPWRDRFLRFSTGASATLVNALVGIIRNKWLAHHLEASGIGILAQVLSSQSWLGTATGLGLGLPVARAVGAATAAGDHYAARKTLWAAFTLLALAGSVVVAFGLLFAPPISQALLGSNAYAPLVRISMVGVVGIALQQTLVGLFAGRSDLRASFTFALAGGGVATMATLLLVPRLGLAGGALGAAILAPAGCVGALYLHRRAYASVMLAPPRPWLTRGLSRSLLTVAGAGLLSALIEQGTLLALRAHYIRLNGVASNGLLQAALALSQQVGALFYTYLGSYAFGKISGVDGVTGTRDYTRRQWIPLMLLAALALGFTMLAATPLLRLLYSHRFDPAQPLMAWALVGEFGRVGLQAWALGSLPLGGARLWFPISLFFPVSLALTCAVFTATGAGLLSLPRAYAFAGLFAACAGGALMSRRGVTLAPRDIAVFLGGAAFLVLLATWVGR